MPDLSDRVAIIALVVSLIALLIASTQALAQLFGTAEGYRRCSAAVIGPWHRLRWREWYWTEFRYETFCITPKLSLFGADDYAEWEELSRQSGIRHLRDVEPKPDRRPRYWEVVSWRDGEAAVRDACDVVGATLYVGDGGGGSSTPTVLEKGLDGTVQRQSTNVLALRDMEQGVEERNGLHRGPALRTRVARVTLRNENQASWLRLLPAIYDVYRSYPAQQKPTSQFQIAATGPSPSAAAAVETDAAITFSQWSWDMMPGEVSKPLATTTLGALIVFALRMGMQWRYLDSGGKQMLADGNGVTFSFTDTPGLGWVAKFSRTRAQRAYPRYIPSRAVDKLMCGIIPSCREFIAQDFRIVDDDRQANAASSIARDLSIQKLNNCLKDFGGSDDTGNQPQDPDTAGDRQGDNDAVTLLCDFLPLPSSNMHEFAFHGWSNRPAIFHFWETRLAFLRHLQDLQKRSLDPSAPNMPPDLQHILQSLEHLRTTYPNDFFRTKLSQHGRAASASDHSDGDAAQKQTNLQHDCREIFDWTTRWLHAHDGAARDKDGHTRFLHLVVAHWMMTYQRDGIRRRAHQQWRKKRERYDEWKRMQKEEVYGLGRDVPPGYAYFHARMFERAKAYVHDVSGGEGAKGYVRAYMRGLEFEGAEEGEGDVVVAWWVLMLRGVAWDLPLVENTVGAAIPSSLYNDQTPVWIT